MTATDPAADVAVFAERVLGRPLWEHQIEAARSSAFVTVVAKARRTGGTTLVSTLAAWTCFRERNVKAVILSAGQEASRRVTEELGADLGAAKLARGAVADDFATRIRLVNGSEIVSLPASQRAVRGLGRGVKLLVVDEAGFVAEELWRAARYVALDERENGGRILLCGTPWGGPELFFRRAFDAGRQGDPEHSSYHWTYKANPRLDHAYLERERDRTSPSEYAAEVLGEWSDEAGALFPRELLDAQTADLELPTLAQLRGPARGYAGVDFGVSFDRSAVAVFYRLPISQLNDGDGGPVLPVFTVVPHVWPVKTPLHQVVAEVAAAADGLRLVIPESSGVGAMPVQELARALRERRGIDRRTRLPREGGPQIHPMATTNATKTAGYGLLLGLLERGQLVLPRDPTLLRELAGLRFEQGERGFTRIEADTPAQHDDVADACYLATGVYKPRYSRHLTAALRLRAVEETRDAWGVAELAGAPTVSTGAGLTVFARPPLQSVFGDELSLPDKAPGGAR